MVRGGEEGGEGEIEAVEKEIGKEEEKGKRGVSRGGGKGEKDVLEKEKTMREKWRCGIMLA